jgi:hypothetical protein
LDTDTELIDLFSTGSLASGDTEWKASEYTAANISLDLALQDPADKVEPFTILKTVYVPAVVITSDGYTSNVNANAQQTFDFKSEDGDIIIYSGSR